MQQQRRQEKEQQRLAQQRQAAIRKRVIIGVVALLVVAAAAISVTLFITSRPAQTATNSSTPGAPGVAATVVDPNYQPVDGIYCEQGEQLAYHIHAHLTIYIDGQPVTVPQGIGISPSNSCIYWLHTHATDGVIHIESPTVHLYTLQNFLDIWESFNSSQINFPTQLASPDGWTIYVNGKQVKGPFSNISLHAHDVVTLVYNSPGIKPDTVYAWQPGE